MNVTYEWLPKMDEPELEPLNTDHILFPMMFLGGGLALGFLTFLLETMGLMDKGRRGWLSWLTCRPCCGGS